VSDPSDERRDAIHALLQELGPAGVEKSAVLVGWAVVADWMDESGERWLSKAHSATVPTWIANSYHHEALYGEWPDGDPDEDDD
jgi:hypothetical protein